LRYTKNKYFLV